MKATGRSMEIEVDPTNRPGDVPLYITDASRVQADFDWEPARPVEQIVRETAEWVKANQDGLRAVFE